MPEQDRTELLLIDTLTGVEAKCLPILGSLGVRYGENRQRMLCSQVMQYIDQWYADPSLSAVTLAEHFGLSSGHLATLLRRFHFASPAAAIEKRRVEARRNCCVLPNCRSVRLLSAPATPMPRRPLPGPSNALRGKPLKRIGKRMKENKGRLIEWEHSKTQEGPAAVPGFSQGGNRKRVHSLSRLPYK